MMKSIDALWNKYIAENGVEPKFAECQIQYLDTPNERQDVTIKMSEDDDKNGDDNVFFYCSSLNDFKSLTDRGSVDFKVTDIYSFNTPIIEKIKELANKCIANRDELYTHIEVYIKEHGIVEKREGEDATYTTAYSNRGNIYKAKIVAVYVKDDDLMMRVDVSCIAETWEVDVETDNVQAVAEFLTNNTAE